MKKYLAILRGINVGGKRKLKMAELKEQLVSLGLGQIQTYIQSGNLVFLAEEQNPNDLAQQIAQKIETDYGFEVPVIVKDEVSLKKVFENNPFLGSEEIDISHLHVTFLAKEASEDGLETVLKTQDAPNEIKIGEEALYLFCPQGYSKTKFTNGFLEKKLQVTATTRNWKTVTKLVEMLHN